MAATQHYDALVIGSGQAGTPLARALAESGRRTALIERAHVGGTCVNEGCTPSTLMSVLQLAMLGGVTWRTLRDAVFAHPLLAESLNNRFAEL